MRRAAAHSGVRARELRFAALATHLAITPSRNLRARTQWTHCSRPPCRASARVAIGRLDQHLAGVRRAGISGNRAPPLAHLKLMNASRCRPFKMFWHGAPLTPR